LTPGLDGGALVKEEILLRDDDGVLLEREITRVMASSLKYIPRVIPVSIAF
jgi:hypothetical protein